MLDGACEMILTAKSLALNPQESSNWQRLADDSRVVSDSIKNLVNAIRDKAPGQTECDLAIERMNNVLRQVDQASLAVINQALLPRSDNSEQGFHAQMNSSAQQILERINGVRAAATHEAENLGHRVKNIIRNFDELKFHEIPF